MGLIGADKKIRVTTNYPYQSMGASAFYLSFFNFFDAVVLALGCYPMRLQYWQRSEVAGLFTVAYMGMAPAFGYFGTATRSSCRCPELSACL